MNTTRAQVLLGLRRWGQPVTSATLARWLGCSPDSTSQVLQQLAHKELVNRRPNPANPRWYLYSAKAINA